MGPLHIRSLRIKGLKIEASHDVRVEEYKSFLLREGNLVDGENVLVGVRGKEIAILTSLPETHLKKSRRMGVQFKMGDVSVIIDMLRKVEVENDLWSLTPDGYTDYQKDINGNALQRTMHLSKIVLPPLLEGSNRTNVLCCTVLEPCYSIEGRDVYRLKTKEIEALSECENDIFILGE